jgi:hypothetical protein
MLLFVAVVAPSSSLLLLLADTAVSHPRIAPVFNVVLLVPLSSSLVAAMTSKRLGAAGLQ